MTEADDPVLEGLWKKVVTTWGEDERHQAFVAYCREAKCLDEAARRYRSVAEGNEAGIEGDAEEVVATAKKRLAGVATIAVATLEADRTEPGAVREHRIVRWVAYVVFVLLLVLLAYALSPALRD